MKYIIVNLNFSFVFDKNKEIYAQYVYIVLFLSFFFSFFSILGLHPQHTEVPRLGVALELQLPSYYSHSNSGSEPHHQSMPQLAAMPHLIH